VRHGHERVATVGQAHVQTGNADVLCFPDNSFAAVVFSQVLLYVGDVACAQKEAQRVLRPGGRTVILDTDWDSLIVNTKDSGLFERIVNACCDTFVNPH